ncbi:MAG: hypothetical protein ACT4N5_04740 [Nitrosopumilaceae archaeon]
MKFFIIFLLVLVVFVAFIDDAIAYTVNFPVNNHRVTRIPTYCGIEPDLPDVSPEVINFWMEETGKAVSDWKIMLGNANNEHRDRWDMKYVTVPVGQKYNATNCDIQIYFQDKPNPEDSFSYLGYLQNNIIKVFYLDIGTCQTQEVTQRCYKDDALRTPASMGSTLRHEIGHSLGLGHYSSDDNKVNLAWYKGTEEIPSIMFPAPENPTLRTIKDVDIEKVGQIYGLYGFFAFSKDSEERSDVLITGSITSVNSIESFGISNEVISIKQYQPHLEKFYGQVSSDLYKKGQKVFLIITRPDFSPEVLSVTPSSEGIFEIPHVFDKNAQKGQYFVEISYMGYVDNEKAFSFSVTDETSSTQSRIVKSQILDRPVQIPLWLKNNAKQWSDGELDDKNFLGNLKYLVSEEIVSLPEGQFFRTESIPSWVKNNAEWWYKGEISDNEFVFGIQYLVSNGLVKMNP